MRRSYGLTTAAIWMALSASVLSAADLTNIERTIGKEPEYESKSPRYVLLVLGPEAQTRIWIVRDGRTLYVDANANGDLTDPGERLQPGKAKTDPAPFGTVAIKSDELGGEYTLKVTGWGWFEFDRGESDGLNLSLSLTGPDKRRYGAWGDERGDLAGGAAPHDAPVIHMLGPLQMGFEIQQPLQPQEKGVYELNAAVGTPGLGAGSFSWLLYNVIPEEAHPVAVLEFPSKDPTAPPVRVETTLDHRC